MQTSSLLIGSLILRVPIRTHQASGDVPPLHSTVCLPNSNTPAHPVLCFESLVKTCDHRVKNLATHFPNLLTILAGP